MNVPEKNLLRRAILCSIQSLKDIDGELFEENGDSAADKHKRKLHEVCINHKLAEHLKEKIWPLWDKSQRMYVDIEFNREGINPKLLPVDGCEDEIRPDIIVHNRKWDSGKFNLLVVECKKSSGGHDAIQKDIKKIRALMSNPRYDYHFGLQVIYGDSSVTGTLFYKENGSIKEEPTTA